MIALALVLALAAPQAQGKPPEDAGTVWLTGDELAPPASQRAALLLAAAAPESPAPLDARAWGGAADTRVLSVDAAAGAPDDATLAAVRGARRLLLGPGDLAQWRAALWNGPRPSALAESLLEAWGGGAEVAARGAGALLLGTWHLDAPDDAPARNPRAQGRAIVRPGLGLVAGWQIDGAARVADLAPLGGRWLAGTTSNALWIAAGAGLCCEPGSRRLTGLAATPVLRVGVLGPVAHVGRHVNGFRIDWLSEGRSGAFSGPRGRSAHDFADPEPESVEDPWSAECWLAPLAAGSSRSWSGDGVRVHLHSLAPAADGTPAAELRFELED